MSDDQKRLDHRIDYTPLIPLAALFSEAYHDARDRGAPLTVEEAMAHMARYVLDRGVGLDAPGTRRASIVAFLEWLAVSNRHDVYYVVDDLEYGRSVVDEYLRESRDNLTSTVEVKE